MYLKVHRCRVNFHWEMKFISISVDFLYGIRETESRLGIEIITYPALKRIGGYEFVTMFRVRLNVKNSINKGSLQKYWQNVV